MSSSPPACFWTRCGGFSRFRVRERQVWRCVCRNHGKFVHVTYGGEMTWWISGSAEYVHIQPFRDIDSDLPRFGLGYLQLEKWENEFQNFLQRFLKLASSGHGLTRWPLRRVRRSTADQDERAKRSHSLWKSSRVSPVPFRNCQLSGGEGFTTCQMDFGWEKLLIFTERWIVIRGSFESSITESGGAEKSTCVSKLVADEMKWNNKDAGSARNCGKWIHIRPRHGRWQGDFFIESEEEGWQEQYYLSESKRMILSCDPRQWLMLRYPCLCELARSLHQQAFRPSRPWKMRFTSEHILLSCNQKQNPPWSRLWNCKDG